MNRIFLACIFVGSSHAQLVSAQSVCLSQAQTQLEKVFCEVKASRHGRSLPALHDFRRNPPQTQSLLLRRPAEKLGLKLPAYERSSRSASPVSVSQEPSATREPPVSQKPLESSISSVGRLCVLGKLAIICRGDLYALMNNIPNSALAPDALTAFNRLVLPRYGGSLKDIAGVQAYLLSVYPVYLQKMIDIGLGASTMSFTKFFHTFQEVKRLKAPFATRMTSMYEHLKEDKKNIATPARFGQSQPRDLNQCDAVGARFIVCDDVKHNWVYLKR